MNSAAIRPFVKICGVKNAADLVACAKAQVDWIGLNFHPLSPRFLNVETARTLVDVMPLGIEAVGVFVDRTVDEIARTAEAVGLRIVQLHGDETPETVRDLCASFRVVKAFRIVDEHSFRKTMRFVDKCAAHHASLEAVLIDSSSPGTGTSIPLEWIEEFVQLPRLILAGGLTPENVADRVRRFRPWMVDVAGGVESTRGQKDPVRIDAFVRAARRLDETSASLSENLR